MSRATSFPFYQASYSSRASDLLWQKKCTVSMYVLALIHNISPGAFYHHGSPSLEVLRKLCKMS
jgi:hypothetical protein